MTAKPDEMTDEELIIECMEGLNALEAKRTLMSRLTRMRRDNGVLWARLLPFGSLLDKETSEGKAKTVFATVIYTSGQYEIVHLNILVEAAKSAIADAKGKEDEYGKIN